MMFYFPIKKPKTENGRTLNLMDQNDLEAIKNQPKILGRIIDTNDKIHFKIGG